MTPHVVVFDLGKVLLDFDYGIPARKLAARSRLSPAEIRSYVDHSPLLYRFETGLMTEDEFFWEVRQAIGFAGDYGEFAEIFADMFWPIALMVDWQAHLRARRVPTYIFSNTNCIHIPHIRRCFPFFGGFDGYIFSYEIGAMKPAAAAYEAIERLTGRQGLEILYLDDRQENAEGGRARGWRTIEHRSAEATLAVVRQWLPA